MGFLQTVKKLLGVSAPPRPLSPPPEPVSEEPEFDVPEITAADLQSALNSELPPLMLDVREPYEWRQVRMANGMANGMADMLHIPMNDVPERLTELPSTREIIVICAHGQRSYGVAYYLIENGYSASSLAGGITTWAAQGGEVEM